MCSSVIYIAVSNSFSAAVCHPLMEDGHSKRMVTQGLCGFFSTSTFFVEHFKFSSDRIILNQGVLRDQAMLY